jgi:hypothetical protein
MGTWNSAWEVPQKTTVKAAPNAPICELNSVSFSGEMGRSVWMALKISTAAQLIPKRKAQVFISLFSSDRAKILHHAAQPVMNHAAQAPC